MQRKRWNEWIEKKEKRCDIKRKKRRRRSDKARKGRQEQQGRQVVGYREYNGIRYRIMPSLKTLILSRPRVCPLNIV